MSQLTAEEQGWYDKLLRRFPRRKHRTLKRNAKMLAKGWKAPLLAAIPPQPAREAGSTTDGLPDSAAYWWGCKGHDRTVPAREAKPGRPEILPEEL